MIRMIIPGDGIMPMTGMEVVCIPAENGMGLVDARAAVRLAKPGKSSL